jgi:hypothetical protein
MGIDTSILVINGLYYQNVWHVSTTGSDSTGDGSDGNPFSTIQTAIDLSSDGDSVLVEAGTYIENINFNGKNIVVTSADGPGEAVIDGNESGSVVTFENEEDSTAVLSGFILTNGYATNGGGIFLSNSSPILINVTLMNNNANSAGGGMYMYQSSPKLTNVTITSNLAGQAGGGMYLASSSSATLTSCIIWYNNPSQWSTTGGSSVTATYSAIRNINDWYGEGIIKDNPLFCAPYSSDYTLAQNSPCIGAGLNGTNMGALGVGCETVYNGPVWHVNTIGSDSTGNGSVNSPFSTIQYSISYAHVGDTVLVQPGTYYENITWPWVNGIKLISAGDEGNTIIDGGGNETVLQISYNYINSSTLIQGFTLTNGGRAYQGGGGITLWYSDPTITNVRVIQNYAYSNYSGGGIFLHSSHPTLTNVNVYGNSADYGAGGMYLAASSPTLTNVSITDNSTSSDGGGMILDFSSPLLTNVTISGNTSEFSGGGVYMKNNSSPSFMNCIMWNDFSQEIYFHDSGDSNSATISYSNIQGGQDSIVTNGNGTVTWSDGNIVGNPLFCNPDSGDFTLAGNSPCVGSGEDGANMGAFGVGCGIQVDWDFSLSEPVIEVMGTDNVWNPGDTISVEMDFCNNTDVAHNWYPGVTIESDSSLTSLLIGHIWFYAMVADTCHAISWSAIADRSIISDTIVTFRAYPEALNCQNQPEYCIDGDTLTFEVPIVVQVVSAEPKPFIPEEFSLHQNYPNPFNPVTTLRYDLPENSLVNIIIYDMLGKEVKTLINKTQDAGYRSIIWDATNDYGKPVSAGIYLYQIQAGKYMQTKKMVLLK